MASTLSISGLVSGLDTNSIVSQLIALERTKITQLEEKKSTYETKLNLWQSLNTRLLALKESISRLSSPTAFRAKATAVSNESVLSAVATSSALTGSYRLEVQQLAYAHQIASSTSYENYDTLRFGEGTITLQVGGGAVTEITIDSTSNTLEGIKNAIMLAQAGVKAAMVRDQTGYRLLLTSNTTGSQGAITFTANLTGGDAELSGMTELQSAQNARILLGVTNPIVYESSSNVVSGFIPGVTLTLKSTGTVNLTVAEDRESIKSALRDFIEKYNDLVDFVDENASYNVTTERGGALLGDANLYRVVSGVANQVLGRISYTNSGYDSLAMVGISVDRYGKLSLQNETKLNDALETNFEAVQGLFVGGGSASEKGLAVLLKEHLAFATDSYQGTVKRVRDFYSNVIKDIDERIELMEERLEREEERLYTQFAALEKVLATYQTQSEWLTQQIANLSKNWRS